MLITPEQEQALIAAMIEAARTQPGRSIDFRDASGAVVATITAHDTPKRPKDMPRHLRPKRRLSKRQRSAAKREKVLVQA